MTTKKYYAVVRGIEPGIYESWEKCQKQIKGFSNASYKSFLNKEDAITFFENGTSNKKEIIIPDKDTAIAYVDGSFNPKTKVYGYGVIFVNDKSTYQGCGDKDEVVEMRNVAGEILGSSRAIVEAIKKGYKRIIIYYDYAGIEKWANGEWKTNKSGTKKYKEFVEEKRKLIDVQFEKVKAHSGVEFNEVVDKLAKEACGVE